MAKSGRTKRVGLRSIHRIHLELDNLVRDIEYCRLENIRFEPDTNSFQFIGGRWVADHLNFPIDDDNDLDLMIIVTGNPGTRPALTVKIDNRTPTNHPSNTTINTNGRAHFLLHLPI